VEDHSGGARLSTINSQPPTCSRQPPSGARSSPRRCGATFPKWRFVGNRGFPLVPCGGTPDILREEENRFPRQGAPDTQTATFARMPKTDQELRGLGGWLIWLAIILIGTPGNLSSHAEKAERVFHAPAMAALITPGTATYDPRWQTLVTIETSVTKWAVMPSLMLILLFFLKHRYFPMGFSLFACFMMALAIIRAYLVFSTPSTSDAYRNSVAGPTIVTLAFLAAWTTYLFRSRRVRLTFTRRVYPKPFFPFFTIA